MCVVVVDQAYNVANLIFIGDTISDFRFTDFCSLVAYELGPCFLNNEQLGFSRADVKIQ